MNVNGLVKGVLVCAAVVAAVLPAPALAHDGMHPDAPNPSPNATVTQEVGYADVTVEFGRPGVKGRTGEIWGKLVPYNAGEPRPWMGGANGNTVITFEEKVKIDGHDLAAGSYGLLMIPAADAWTFIFSTNSKRLGIMQYTPDEDALRIEVSPEKADHQEWLNYEFKKVGDVTSSLSLHWENLSVGFTIEAMDHREEKSSDG